MNAGRTDRQLVNVVLDAVQAQLRAGLDAIECWRSKAAHVARLTKELGS